MSVGSKLKQAIRSKRNGLVHRGMEVLGMDDVVDGGVGKDGKSWKFHGQLVP